MNRKINWCHQLNKKVSNADYICVYMYTYKRSDIGKYFCISKTFFARCLWLHITPLIAYSMENDIDKDLINIFDKKKGTAIVMTFSLLNYSLKGRLIIIFYISINDKKLDWRNSPEKSRLNYERQIRKFAEEIRLLFLRSQLSQSYQFCRVSERKRKRWMRKKLRWWKSRYLAIEIIELNFYYLNKNRIRNNGSFVAVTLIQWKLIVAGETSESAEFFIT